MSDGRVYRFCTARDGRQFVIREAVTADAMQILAHTRSMLGEPQWNVTELAEFQRSPQQEEEWISSFRERLHNILLVADTGNMARPEIVGVLSFNVQPRFRLRHRGRLGIGVHAAYRGLGIGEALLQALLDWAEAEPEVERVELSVLAHNTRAISLYRKLGFVEEARLYGACKLADGTYYDDLMMVKWVKPGNGNLAGA